MSARKIKRSLLVCPSCGSDQVTVRAVTSYMVNTGEHYCHSVKTHDGDAQTKCLACNWDGLRQDLKEQTA